MWCGLLLADHLTLTTGEEATEDQQSGGLPPWQGEGYQGYLDIDNRAYCII